jgi:hypothetical protein
VKAFIIFRDRVTYAKQCIRPLLAAGLDVHVIDHASTWPPALAWLAGLEHAGIAVHYRGANAYPWQVWEWDVFRSLAWGSEPYLVTDPDVTVSGDCPPDWPARLTQALTAHPAAIKAGLGLRLDRIPAANPRKASILAWESFAWEDAAAPGVFRANVDTTLAVYRPWDQYPLFALGPALRLDHPYVADHLSWYETQPLTAEQEYYYAHSDPGHLAARTVR